MFNTIDLRIPVRVKAVWLNMLFYLYSLAGASKNLKAPGHKVHGIFSKTCGGANAEYLICFSIRNAIIGGHVANDLVKFDTKTLFQSYPLETFDFEEVIISTEIVSIVQFSVLKLVFCFRV